MTNPSQIIPGSSLGRWIGWTLLIVLILAAAGELTIRGFGRALYDLQDFGVIYSSTRAFVTGHNPYDSAAMQAEWSEANHKRPNGPAPVDLALYPPPTYLLLSPLAFLDWAAVRWAWLLANAIAIAVLLVTLTRYWPGNLPPWKIALAAAFILGFGPIHTAIYKGQLTVLVTAVLALAIVAEDRRAVVFAAILLAVAGCLKPQIAAPVVLLYLFQRRWKAIAVMAGVTLSLLGVASLRLYWAGVSWIGLLLRNLSLASKPGGVYDPAPTNPLLDQLVNTSALLRRLTNNRAIVALVLVAIGLAVCFLLWKRGRFVADLLSDRAAFGTACVLGLVLISHRYYDAAVLLFVFVWALSEATSRLRIPVLIAIAGCFVLAFPGQVLLRVSGHSQAPSAIPQPLWDALVMQHQSWILLVVLAALTTALTVTPPVSALDPRPSEPTTNFHPQK